MVELLKEQLRIVKHRGGVFSAFFWPSSFSFLASVDQCLILSESCQLIIVVISVEKALHGVPPQISQIILELRIVEIFPLLIDVFQVEVILHRWNEWSSQPLFVEILPGEVSQPWVVLDLVRARTTKSVLRLSLNHLVHKVSSLDRSST